MKGAEMMLKAMGIDPAALMADAKEGIEKISAAVSTGEEHLAVLRIEVASAHTKLDAIMVHLGLPIAVPGLLPHDAGRTFEAVEVKEPQNG